MNLLRNHLSNADPLWRVNVKWMITIDRIFSHHVDKDLEVFGRTMLSGFCSQLESDRHRWRSESINSGI